MKKIFWIAAVLMLSAYTGHSQDQYNDNPPAQNNQSTDDVYYNNNNNYNEEQGDNSGLDYQTFYDDLSPYGSWVNYPGYGYCWVPQTDGDFAPYMTNGHWVYTDYGWTWVSDYPWGWATFHYGRWFQDAAYGGWLWCPGYDWGPAWVAWGGYDAGYCWAPLWPGEVISAGWGGRDHHWYYVDHAHFMDARLGSFVVRHDEAGFGGKISVINHVNTYNRGVFFAGPKAEDVQKATGHAVERVQISNMDKAGATKLSGNSVGIYRPAMKRTSTQSAVPKNIARPEDVHNAHPANAQPAHNEPQKESPAPQRVKESPAPRERESPEPQQRVNNPPARQASPPREQPSRPVEQSRPSGGGFVPSERPSAPMRSAPSAAPRMGGGGGGGHGGGGGRH